MIWAVLIAVAVFLYVALDGFDLGVGILFPFAKDARERDQMQAAIAPVWDGNETWLVLGGGGLFAAFPKAYAALMPALYLPIFLMLMALIFRGVAFEFRHHGRGRGQEVVDDRVFRRLDRRGDRAGFGARRLHSGRDDRRRRSSPAGRSIG